MRLFKDSKKLWSTAYYQENGVSPFKFEWDSSFEEDMQNPYYNMDERSQRGRIIVYDDIQFRKDDNIYIDNVKYLIDRVDPITSPEYLNNPYFKKKHIGVKITLIY